MRNSVPPSLVVLLVIYLIASLVHFVHNAEFLRDYPNLPASWTRPEIYCAWVGMTIVGASGYMIIARGYPRLGLLFLVLYSGLGLDSLGHYAVAPMAAHTTAMNSTILLEVTAAAALLAAVLRLLLRAVLSGPAAVYDA
jgi:hypothetical protein